MERGLTVHCASHSQGLMHLQGKPVCSFDPEGLIFAAGINSEMVKLYDLRSFDKVRGVGSMHTRYVCKRCKGYQDIKVLERVHLPLGLL